MTRLLRLFGRHVGWLCGLLGCGSLASEGEYPGAGFALVTTLLFILLNRQGDMIERNFDMLDEYHKMVSDLLLRRRTP